MRCVVDVDGPGEGVAALARRLERGGVRPAAVTRGRLRLDAGGAPDALLARLSKILDSLEDDAPGLRVRVRNLERCECGQDTARAVRCGGLRIEPVAGGPCPRPDPAAILLDPARAFGTGLHPTTRLCLELLQQPPLRGRLPGARVADVGCGSGVLALAALRLGAAGALGVDVEAAAARAARANAIRNGLAHRFLALHATADCLAGPCDMVLANLPPALLLATLPRIACLLAPGGAVLASGFTPAQRRTLERTAAAHGLHAAEQRERDGWCAAALTA
jgi:ribosomal protein L11 methyltransferase